jgi:hypothetical protein
MRILVLLLVLAGAAFAGWHYKGRILAWINPPPSADHPAEQPDVLYSWVDKAGVTHYEQDAGKGTRIIYDGSRITRMEPVPPEVIARAEAAAEAAKPKGSQTLHELRNDLQRKQPVQQGQGGDL